MDDETPMTDRQALLIELICNIDMRDANENERVLFQLLRSAWPTGRAQHC